MGTLDVKGRGLVLSLMPHSVLKCAPRSATGLKQPRGLWHSTDNLRAEQLSLWHSAGKFYHEVGIPQFI
jgi:hypothetical protein